LAISQVKNINMEDLFVDVSFDESKPLWKTFVEGGCGRRDNGGERQVHFLFPQERLLDHTWLSTAGRAAIKLH
jgi:hypothetical protein